MTLFGKSKKDDPLELITKKDFKRAITVLEKLISEDPANLSHKIRYAEALEGAGRLDDAFNVYLKEGNNCIQNGFTSKGLALVRRAENIIPNDPTVREILDGAKGKGQGQDDGSFEFDISTGSHTPPQLSISPEEDDHKEKIETTENEVPTKDPFSVKYLLQDVFSSIDDEDIERLVSITEVKRLKAGDVIIEEGKEGRSLFVVGEGSLKAITTQEDGTQVNLATLWRGDILGEVAFLNNVPRTATIMAEEDSIIISFSNEDVLSSFRDKPEFMNRLEEILISRVEATINLLRKQYEGSEDGSSQN